MKKMSANLNKLILFDEEVNRTWEWLRDRSEYKKDYKIQECYIKEGRILPRQILAYEFRKQRSKKSENHVLSGLLFPSPQVLKEHVKFQRKMVKRWGFFPLENPQSKYRPFGLTQYIESLNQKSIESAVKSLNIPLDVLFINTLKIPKLTFKKPKLPKELIVSIDFRRSNADIFAEIKHQLKVLRKHYRVKVGKEHFAEIKNSYTIKVGKQLGYEGKQLYNSDFMDGKKDPKNLESFRKKMERILSKQKVRTK